jgi:hypothetical protein
MFEASPLCGEFLRGLGCKDDDPLLVSFQWDAGFWFGDDLYGRVTRTTLVIPYTGLPEREAWGFKIGVSFNGFMPAGCEALRLSLPRPFGWQAFAWVDTVKQALALKDMVEQAQPSAVTGRGEQQDVGDQEKAVGYHFFRWNGNDASPEREDATTRDPKAKGSWDKTLAKTMPPDSFWEQERWDVKLAPCYRVEPASEDEEEEDEDEESEALTGLNAEDAAYPVDDAAPLSSLAQYQQQEEDHRQGELLDGALHCVVLLHLHFLWRNPLRPRPRVPRPTTPAHHNDRVDAHLLLLAQRHSTIR